MSKAGPSCNPITRRAAIAATLAAAAPACLTRPGLVAPAVAAPSLPTSDPALAAIAAHREACARFERACRLTSDLERQIPADRRQEWFREDREAGIGAGDDPRWTAAVAAGWAACDAEDRAAWALARVRPRDPAAAAALVRYVGDVEAESLGWPDPPEDEDGDWSVTFHHNLAAALEAMA